MCTENFIITKRDGTTERFSLDKIKSAILKAFTSLHQPIDAQGLQRVSSSSLTIQNYERLRIFRTKWKWP